MSLVTMPNERPEVATWVENSLDLPCCCPVSQNPQPGSTLSLRYRAGDRVLEVFNLKRYVTQFVGGHPDGTRNMETMIQKIAQDCANVLGVPVRARADLRIAPDQRMRLFCTAEPDDLLSRHASGGLAGPGDDSAVRLPAAAAGSPPAASRYL